MNISQKIKGFMLNKVQPIANKFEKEPHITAIKNGFIVTLPFLIMGSFMMILLIPPYSPDTTSSFGMAWLNLADRFGPSLWRIYQMSFNSIALFASATIAYYLAKEYNMQPIHSAILSLMSFLLISMPYKNMEANITFLGGRGLFVAIFIAIYSVELTRFMNRHNFVIRMPKEVPEAVADSFNILLPVIAVLATLYPIALIIETFMETTVPVLVENIMKPLITASDTIWAIIFFTLAVHILWFFGINGALIFMQLWTPFLLINLGSNLEGWRLGENLPHIITNGFWDFYVTHGGSGGTISLGFALAFFCKSKLCKTIGKVGLIPSFFSITDPIIYGLPIILNPIFFIPLIFAPILNAVIAYFLTSWGIVPRMFIMAPWTTPAPIGAFIATGGSFKAAILSLSLIILDFFIYLPFAKIYDRVCLTEEKNNETETEYIETLKYSKNK